jgi:F0F1-type ATP synthase membrane subunit b/b'
MFSLNEQIDSYRRKLNKPPSVCFGQQTDLPNLLNEKYARLKLQLAEATQKLEQSQTALSRKTERFTQRIVKAQHDIDKANARSESQAEKCELLQ